MKKLTTALLATTAALTLTACANGFPSSGSPSSPATVTVTATPTASPATLREQFQSAGLPVIGLQNSTIIEAGEALCEARGMGASHKMVSNIAYDGLQDYYSPRDIETALGLWYENICPEHAS